MTTHSVHGDGVCSVDYVAPPVSHRATVTLSAPSGGIAAAPDEPRQYATVWVKERWDGSWTYVPYLEVVDVMEGAMPDMSKAKFRYAYGDMKHQDVAAFAVVRAIEQLDHFICVRIHTEGQDPYTLWCGYLPAEQTRQGGARTNADGNMASYGNQHLTAFGLEYLLARRRLGGTYTVHQDESAVRFVESSGEDFNGGGSRGELIGNRSAEKHATGTGAGQTYVFGTDIDEAREARYTWTWRQAIDYLLMRSLDRTSDAGGDPSFHLSGPAAVLNYLNARVSVIPQGNRSVWEVLRQLIAPSAMLSARIEWSTGTNGFPDGAVSIYCYSLSHSITHVAGAKFPSNPVWSFLSLDNDSNVRGADVGIDNTETYSEIIVEGEKVQTCASFTTRINGDFSSRLPNMPRIDPAWSWSLAGPYEAAEEEDRRSSVFDRLFRSFRVRDGWETDGSIPLVPKFDADGRRDRHAPGEYMDERRRMMTTLPIKEFGDIVSESTEQQFARPFALLLVLDEEGVPVNPWRFVLAHRPGVDGDGEPYPAGISLVPGEGDVTFEMRGTPHHILAINDIDEDVIDQPPRFDFNQMVVTLAFELDVRPRVVVSLPQTGSTSRTLVRRISGAHYWLVDPNTVVGLQDDGRPRHHYDDPAVRDDTDRLRFAAAVLKAYARRPRTHMTVTWHGIRPEYPPGHMIDGILQHQRVQWILAPVASRTWRFGKQGFTTTIRTKHIDPGRISL